MREDYKLVVEANEIQGLHCLSLTPDFMVRFGRAYGQFVRNAYGYKPGKPYRLVLGFDARPSSMELQNALQRGLIAEGINILNVGAATSPLVYFAIHHLKTEGGIVLTGSHRPAGWNGVRLYLGRQPLSEKTTDEILASSRRVERRDLLPSFLILAFAGVFTVERVVRWTSGQRARIAFAVVLFASSLVMPIYLYAQLSRWGERPGFWHARYNNEYTSNTHDCAEFIANPNKRNYNDIAIFAARLFEKLPQGAILIDSDSRTFYPLRYFQIYGHERPDLRLRLVNSWGFDGWGLSRRDFVELLERAHANGEDLFLVSLGHPFDDILAQEKLLERFRFEPFALDSERWIYTLFVETDS